MFYYCFGFKIHVLWHLVEKEKPVFQDQMESLNVYVHNVVLSSQHIMCVVVMVSQKQVNVT